MSNAASPCFSAIIPARNEENHIAERVRSIKRAAREVPEGVEIIVAADKFYYAVKRVREGENGNER